MTIRLNILILAAIGALLVYGIHRLRGSLVADPAS